MPHKDAEERRAYHREYQRKRNAANPEENREAQRRYRERHAEEIKARRADPEAKEREREYKRQYYEEHREEFAERSRQQYVARREEITKRNNAWRVANKGRVREAQNARRKINPPKPPTQEQRARRSARRAEQYNQGRIDALTHYSGGTPACACCGEQCLEFLTFDHINGGGRQHRKEVGAGNMLRWLTRHGYPEGFRVLCSNCNHAHGIYGYCPHEQQRKPSPEEWTGTPEEPEEIWLY